MLGAEDGIRTRDPHLGKVRRSVGLRRLVTLSRAFPVGFSAGSAESAPFLDGWFIALNEPGFADSPPDDRDPAEADSPSNLVRRPARTTETSRRPPSALTYASSTSIVTFRDFSIATIRGCETPICSASSRRDTPARSRRPVRPAARRSSSSISATRFAAPSTEKDLLFPVLQNHDYLSRFVVDFSGLSPPNIY